MLLVNELIQTWGGGGVFNDTSRSSILSPILCNVFINDLKTKDMFVRFSGETKLEERTNMFVDRNGKK